MDEENLSAELRDPLLVAAFEGWNDAADAATGVVDHVLASFEADVFAEMDPDEFYDFQVVRPVVHVEDGSHFELIWPTPTLFLVRDPELPRDLLVFRAHEPNHRWKLFTARLLELVASVGVREVVVLGAMLADVPHTRPLPTTANTNDPVLLERLEIGGSHYTGPVGVTAVLAEAARDAGLSVLQLWAAVPHYVADPPCPPATLGLMGALEDVFGLDFPRGEVRELAEAWLRGVNELMQQDPELTDYVRGLEEERDADGIPEASGEAIARAFERYLERRNRPNP